MSDKNVVLAICGKSATGKSMLRKELGKFCTIVKTYTTRPPRDEVEMEEGDYKFIPGDEFLNHIGKSLRFVRQFNGWMYGVNVNDIERIHVRPLVMVLDPTGVKKLAESGICEVYPIYVTCDLFARWTRYKNRTDCKLTLEQVRRFVCDHGDFKGIVPKLESWTGHKCLTLRSERIDYMRRKVELYLSRLGLEVAT